MNKVYGIQDTFQIKLSYISNKSHHMYSQILNTISNPLFTISLFTFCLKHLEFRTLLYTNKLFIPLNFTFRKRDKIYRIKL